MGGWPLDSAARVQYKHDCSEPQRLSNEVGTATGERTRALGVVRVAADWVGARRVGAWNEDARALLSRCTRATLFIAEPVQNGKMHHAHAHPCSLASPLMIKCRCPELTSNTHHAYLHQFFTFEWMSVLRQRHHLQITLAPLMFGKL